MFSKFQKSFSFILILLSFSFLLPNYVNAVSCISITVSTTCSNNSACTWSSNKCSSSTSASTGGSSSASSLANTSNYLGGTIPNCTDLTKNGCDDVTVFLTSAISIGQYVFGIIGALALVMFVYGGLVWITANGNPEKVKQGMGIFTSAVIGLAIVFSAYMLVKYFGSSILNIQSQYQLQ